MDARRFTIKTHHAMPHNNRSSLWSVINTNSSSSARFLADEGACVELSDLSSGSALGGQTEELRGRSVLVATTSQLAAALALVELDGVVRRLVICPPDLPPEHSQYIVESAEADAVITDSAGLTDGLGLKPVVSTSPRIEPAICGRPLQSRTEWILLTSGTTGRPKMVVHTLQSLTGAIGQADGLAHGSIWSTFYDIRRYGGLQVFLRALLTGNSLVLSSADESTAEFLLRAARRGITHISGTPSHWRKALMCPEAREISPEYLRLSGEIADQAILDNLRSFYPQAQVAHAFASTEAGVAFDVRDGLAGFPASLMREQASGVEIKVENGSLWIRSQRTAARYLGGDGGALPGGDGFVDTGDMLELRGDRYYFVGRRDGVINVGGLKVHPEEVESVIGRHPQVRFVLVRARKNPITGSVVVADVVPRSPATNGERAVLGQEILQLCRETLAPHKVPAAVRLVGELAVSSNGKLVRPRA